MVRFLPVWDWARHYRRADVLPDLTAGLIVAVMLIPQAMAYALLAGLPPIYGLYASIVPAIVYAIFGTSKHMPMGPPALMALLTFTGVSAIAEPHTGRYIELALLLAVAAGVVQLLLGIFRLGFLTNFIPQPVLSGFVFASAVVIIISQLGAVLGIDLAARGSVIDTIAGLADRIDATNPATLTIGMGSIVVLLIVRTVAPKLPGPLMVVVASTVIVDAFGLADRGVAIVGDVPHGIPTFALPSIDGATVQALAPAVVAVVLVGYIETFSIAKAMAARERYDVDANQEFIALGLSNISSGLFSGFAVAGSFSRTAVNHQAGARSQLASVFTSIIVVLALLFLTPLLHDMPLAALAAIIITAVYRLLDVAEVRHVVRVSRSDGVILLLTFVVTLFIGIVWGILLGAAFGLIVFLKQTVRPHVTELGYVADSDAFLGILSHPTAGTDPAALILRFDAPLYYANVSYLQQQLLRSVAQRPELRYIVLDCRGMTSIDGTAINELEGMIEAYARQGIGVMLTQLTLPLRQRIRRAGWHEKFGPDIEQPTTRQALGVTDLDFPA